MGEMSKVKFKPFVLPLLILFCAVFYYFGELVDWAAWNALRQEFFYGIHDIHRLLFLFPIVYAGYMGRVRGAIIVTLITLGIFLPRGFFISPYPDTLLRMMLFVIFAGSIGCLVGAIRNQMIRCQNLRAELTTERDKLLRIVKGMADGVVITGPDYKIRFMNAKMADDFGEGAGLTCYKHLRNVEAPCQQECHIPDVINKAEVGEWECSFPDGRKYEVVAAPYVDTDGTVCQISIFRDITRRK